PRAAGPGSPKGHRQRIQERDREVRHPRARGALAPPKTYLPTKLGFLFSRKALMPSFLSSVPKSAEKRERSRSRPEESPVSWEAETAALAALTASGAFVAISTASF